ncbi:hypothetical protein [Rubrivirga sp.]|uniref:hypothetical protein n=1 Tax=Rubrivirga sp. TaxID=1885344 RepID=UPI003B518B7C
MNADASTPTSRRDRIELISAVLIGLASVLTAVATYQEGALDGEVRDQNTEALAQTSYANDVYNDASAQQAIERDWFFSWNVAHWNDQPAAAYLADAMPPEVWVLIEEWNAAEDDGILDPFSPEAVESYPAYGDLPSVGLLMRGDDHMGAAQCAIFAGRVADNRGGWLSLSVIFLAITLVTAGLAALLKSATAQYVVLGTAVVSLLFGATLLVAGGDRDGAQAEVAEQVFESPDEADLCVDLE